MDAIHSNNVQVFGARVTDELKFLGVIGSAVLAAVQALKPIAERLRKIKSLRARGGELGFIFLICYELPQQIYRFVLFILAAAGLAAIIGFVGKLTNAASLDPLEWFFDNYAVYMIVIWLLTAIVGLSNIVSYILLAIIAISRKLRASPSWINARWFSTVTDKPVPIVIRRTGVLGVSDWVLEQLVNGKSDDSNRAEKPDGLSDDERANAALLGCIIEQEHHIFKWERRPWKDFYDCFASIQINGQSIFNPNTICAFDHEGKSFFETIRDQLNPCLLARGQREIPESAEAAEAIEKTSILLMQKYDGTAVNLARSNVPWGRRFDMGRAFRRAKEFPCLDNDSMRPQCLKLMLVWDVWPSIQPKEFIYPFASNLAAFLVDKNVLLTFDDVATLPFNERDSRAIAREATRRIVENATQHLMTSKMQNYAAFKQTLEAATPHPLEWEIAYRVDVYLWSHSYELVKGDRLEHWQVNSQKLVVRKK